MNLALALDFLSNPLVDIYEDDFSESDYWHHDWLTEAIEYGVTPDLSDLFITEQLNDYSTDTNIYIEYSDLEGNEGFGVIQSWHHYPYFTSNEIDPEENYAYVLCDNGGSTYVHISSMRIIERIVGLETIDESQPMSPVFTPDSSNRVYEGWGSREAMYFMPDTARIACALTEGIPA